MVLETAQLIRNIAVRFPNRNLINLIRTTGASVFVYDLTKDDSIAWEILRPYEKNDLASISKEYEKDLSTRISDLDDGPVSDEAYNDMANKVNELSVEDETRSNLIHKLMAARLRKIYNYGQAKKITPNFVKTYSRLEMVKIYTKFQTIKDEKNYASMLQRLAEKEHVINNELNTIDLFNVLNKKSKTFETKEAFFRTLDIAKSKSVVDVNEQPINLMCDKLCKLVKEKSHLMPPSFLNTVSSVEQNEIACRTFCKDFGVSVKKLDKTKLKQYETVNNKDIDPSHIRILKLNPAFRYKAGNTGSAFIDPTKESENAASKDGKREYQNKKKGIKSKDTKVYNQFKPTITLKINPPKKHEKEESFETKINNLEA